MIDSALMQILVTMIIWGAVGSVLGGAIGYFSGDERLRIGNSAGIGCLIGVAFGATFGIFGSLVR